MWGYGLTEGIEHATWQGACAPGLRLHFHDEVQLTLVLRGERLFRTAAGMIRADAGEAVVFPARLPHAALATPASTESVNFYFPSPALPARGGARVVGRTCRLGDLAGDPHALLAWLAANQDGAEERDEPPPGDLGRIEALARRAGISREAYSRRFSRIHGIAPAAYRVNARLNLARAALRGGVTATEAAHLAGFSDQSHLSRGFRSAFGVPPGHYRAAMHETR